MQVAPDGAARVIAGRGGPGFADGEGRTEARFNQPAGVALAPDDFGTWGAVILHDLLSSPAPEVNGGGFRINGQQRDLQGIILPGGTIATLGGTCRKEAFAVAGDVVVVTGGLGEFNVKLTHYGFRLPTGGCFTYFATVEGLITFALP